MMKNNVLLISAIALVFLISGKSQSDENNRTARVNKIQGYYIFTDSEPVTNYESIGVVKYSMGIGSNQYTAIRKALIKKAKKQYPEQGNGLIFSFVDGGTDTAEVIYITE